MTRRSRALVAMLLGGIAIRLVVTNRFGWFVHQRMRFPLIAGGTALVLIGLYDALHQSEDRDDHEHRGLSNRVGWLLLTPVLVLVGVSPSALGADAASRFSPFDPSTVDVQSGSLPATGTIDMRLFDFRNFALNTKELQGRTITLTGFVVNDPDHAADHFVLTRFLIGCCAADAFRLEIGIRGATQTWDNDTWVKVTGTWIEPTGGAYPVDAEFEIEVQATEVVEVSEPNAPYESLW